MKIIYFVTNGRVSAEDKAKREEMLKGVNKIYFSNGSAKYGYEDSCDAVYLSSDFPHIEKWAQSRGILVMRPETEPQPEPEVTTHAETHSERTEEAQADEEVKPKQRRTRRAKPDNDPSE